MNLLEATRYEIALLDRNSRDRAILEYLTGNAVGHTNAKPWGMIEQNLRYRGIPSGTKESFQNGLLGRSRKEGFFIGACIKGFFIINSREDGEVARETYLKRIRQEQAHLNNLEADLRKGGLLE